jgi:archaemetzincin
LKSRERKMGIGILQFGRLDSNVISRLQESVGTVFPNAEIVLVAPPLQIPKGAFSKTRKQYRSDVILSTVREYAEKHDSFDRVLGIVDVDLFTPRLNFVFGEADSPGKAALISLWRLRPEFYGRGPNDQVLIERGVKEAIHELGHTVGLGHCANPFCVMYFSNSIFETDRKQSLFCGKCYLKTNWATGKGKTLGRHV